MSETPSVPVASAKEAPPRESAPSPILVSGGPVSGRATGPVAGGGNVGSITVSVKAAEAIRRQLEKRGTPESALRVGIRGGGCSGFSYVIEFHDGPPRARDREFLLHGVRVVVDTKSLVYLNGAELDWEQTLMKQGFKFINPHEKSSCGCGHSFTV